MNQDTTVAQTWGVKRFAHFTIVGRRVAACDDQTVAATEAAITAFSRPFVQPIVQEVRRRGQRLIYDYNLTSQAISSTSTTYSHAAFGSLRVNDRVRLGYQLAQVSVAAGPSERI